MWNNIFWLKQNQLIYTTILSYYFCQYTLLFTGMMVDSSAMMEQQKTALI